MNAAAALSNAAGWPKETLPHAQFGGVFFEAWLALQRFFAKIGTTSVVEEFGVKGIA